MNITETELLQHALVGYQARREEIQRRIEELQRKLRGTAAPVDQRPKRHLSAAKGRTALIAATKRRWAKARREKRAKG